MRLDGKRALVTGASSGIGQACAVALAEAGAHVICAARGIDKLRSTFAAKKMQEYGGTIIHISSQMGHVGGVDRAVYCASKHALEGMVKSMAIEWGPKQIRINTICPIFVRTPLTAATFDDPERAAWIAGKIKLGRIGEVEDIMGAVVYLSSGASALVTGTLLLIDGG